MNLSIYPWQLNHWEQLLSRKNNLPHALLFIGPEGVGKKHFAVNLVHGLLCGQPDAPCQKCRACQLTQAGSHPNIMIVEPAEGTNVIKIDQIRDVIHFANETALQSGHKFIILNPASAMNINAANALLKTLEEPALDTLFILITHIAAKLPATITSRCQKIIFNKPSEAEALNWLRATIQKSDAELKLLLNLSSGAPVKAAALAETELFQLRQELYQGLNHIVLKKENPLQLAKQLQEKNMIEILNLIIFWLRDLLRCQLTACQTEIINVEYQAEFARLVKVIPKEKLLRCLDETQKNLNYCYSSLNLNRQLALEKFFIGFGCE